MLDLTLISPSLGGGKEPIPFGRLIYEKWDEKRRKM
jgi:hypothetical protein